MKKFLISAALVGVLAISAVGFGGCAPAADEAQVTTQTATTSPVRGNSGLVQQVESGGMQMSLFSTSTVSETGAAVQTLTAIVKDANGITAESYNDVTWAMAWASETDSTVTDYVSMTSDGATATFTCLKAFSTQIIVTCTSNLKSSLKTTATIDYAKRLNSISVEMNGATSTVAPDGVITTTFEGYSSWGLMDGGDWADVYFDFHNADNYGDGTVFYDNHIESVTVEFSEEFQTVLSGKTALVECRSYKTYYLLNDDIEKISQKDLILNLTGENVMTIYSSLLDITQALAETDNQIIVTIKYYYNIGYNPEVVTYTVNVDIPETELSSVELSSGGLTF